MTSIFSNPEQTFELGQEMCKISGELQIEHSMAKGYILQAYLGFFLELDDKAFFRPRRTFYEAKPEYY